MAIAICFLPESLLSPAAKKKRHLLCIQKPEGRPILLEAQDEYERADWTKCLQKMLQTPNSAWTSPLPFVFGKKERQSSLAQEALVGKGTFNGKLLDLSLLFLGGISFSKFIWKILDSMSLLFLFKSRKCFRICWPLIKCKCSRTHYPNSVGSTICL